MFKPKDSIDIYKDKWFIFYYFFTSRLQYNEDVAKTNYTTNEFDNMSVLNSMYLLTVINL